MNRPAAGPQSLRGLPSQFATQQQIPQNRSVSSRILPGGKMPSNGSWAFGGGMPMGAGLGNPRPNGPMTSFAQTITGSSQPQTPLDLSEFPSLSGNQPQRGQSTWATSGNRNAGPPGTMHLQQQSLLSSQQQMNAQQQTQQQQDDLFSCSSQLPSGQGAFRFGGQNAVGQSSQSNAADDFPPLNRNANGEIGQDRIQSLGFGAQSNGMGFGAAQPSQPSRNNGLLNALSGNNRVPSGNRVASPASLSGVSNSRSPIESSRQVPGGVPENEANTFSSAQFLSTINQPQREDSAPQATMSRPEGLTRDQESAIPRSQTLDSTSQNNAEDSGPDAQDPLTGMSEMDKWGLKGFSYMMNNFPDYAAMIAGDNLPSNWGFDMNTTEQISPQTYSLFTDEPPRPSVPRFTLPECYTVGNIAALDSKLSNFNDEALIFMFYSNPGDIQQILAATELHGRNWRYHKKLQLWLTKDDVMIPQTLGNGTERGYYIFFDVKTWSRERREFTLIYDELENIPTPLPQLSRPLV